MQASERIERFYKDIRGLAIKSPVSAIAEATGENKGNVSKYINQKMQPSESFLNRFYMKFGKVVQKSDTTKPEQPQNGTKSQPPPTLTRIGELIKTIQYKTNPSLSIEQIAERIGYSRGRLTTLVNQGDSQKVFDKLKTEFNDILSDMTTVTTKPNFEMKTNGNEKDATIIKDQASAVKDQAAAIKNHSETINKLTDLVSKLVHK